MERAVSGSKITSKAFQLAWVVCTIGVLAFPRSSNAQFAEAVDTTNLVWTTTGNAGWFFQTGINYDGIDAARSGAIGDTGVTDFQTPVTGPGTVSFWWKVSSQPNADFLQFFIGTNLQAQISGTMDWEYRKFSIPAGAQTLKWRYMKDMNFIGDNDAGWLDQVIFSPVPEIPLQQALNTCGIAWDTGGNDNPTVWTGQTNRTHDGKSAAQSGAVYHLQESWMKTTVIGATNVSFWWKVSSEQDFDFLNFYIGTNLIAAISGEMDWTNRSFALPAGTNELRWQYIKDVTETQGADAGWVDQVIISPTQPAFPYMLTSEKRLSGQRFSFAVTGEVGCACSVLASTNLADWEVFSNFVTTNAVTKLVDNSASNFATRYFRAVSP